MKHYFLCLILLLLTSTHAMYIAPGDNFNDNSLDTDLWQATPSGGFGYSMTGDYAKLTGSGCGGTQLKTNYYFIGDFDAQIANYQTANAAYYTTFRFFKAGFSPSTASHGSDWGYAGNVYSWFPESSTQSWSYSATGSTSYNLGNQWFELRIQRIGNDINTYHRLLGDENWILQNSYSNFGSDAVYLSFIAGNGSSSSSTTAYIDNFSANGYTDTDPQAQIQSIPEASSIFLIIMGLAVIVYKIKK